MIERVFFLVHSKHCLSIDNVITSYDTPVNTESLPSGSCYLTVLNEAAMYPLEYVKFFTNSNDNVTFFDPAFPEIIIFQFK